MNTQTSNQWLQNIFNDYARTIYRLIIYITKNRQVAEDIIQEAFLELHFLDKNRFHDNEKTRAWLIKTAKNKSLNYIKREKKLNYVSADFFDNIATDIKTNPEVQLIEKELLQEIKKAVQSLPDDFQTVILLYYYAELTYTEISNILNISIGTVKSRLNRGRLLIKKQLIKFEEEPIKGVPQP